MALDTTSQLYILFITILFGLLTTRQCVQSHQSSSSAAKIYTIVADAEQQVAPYKRRPYSWVNSRLVARKLDLGEQLGQEKDQEEEEQKAGFLRELGHSQAEWTSVKRRQIPWRGDKDTRWPAAPAARHRPLHRAGGGRRATTKTAGRRAGGGKQSSARRALTPLARKAPPPAFGGHLEPQEGGLNATSQRRQPAASKRKNLVCYYGTWAVYRPDAGKFSVENIDPFLCTHVIYGFTGLSFDNVIKPLDPWNDLEDNYGKGAMKRFTNLKRQNPELKTLVAIGGWNEGSIKYSKMASDPEARARFVNSVVAFLAKHNFDGLDLDWEYPGSRGGASYDKQNFVRLLRELSAALKPRGYLLTAAVSAGKWFIDAAYDIPQVSKYLDLINLMAYDYHGGWEPKTGMNAPLFASARHERSLEERQLNVNWSLNYWLSQGAEREKLMLGVGSYGRSFTLDRESDNGINAPAAQKGRAGPYTREPGSLGYNEICELLLAQPQQQMGANRSTGSTWTIVRDPDYLAPYAFTNNGQRQWVGYDDRQSLALKAQLAKSMGLGGMMMWSIETDDFQGRCHGGEKFPLLKTLRRALDGPEPVLPVVPPGGGSGGGGGGGGGGATKPASTTPAPQPKPSTTTARPGHEVEEVDEQQRPAASTSRPRPPATSRRPITTTTRRPSSTSSTSTTAEPHRPPPPQPPPQPQQPQEFTCTSDGLFADPRNCRKFLRCVGAGTNLAQRFHFDCGPGTAFNQQLQACDHIYNVPACQRPHLAAGPNQPVVTSGGGADIRLPAPLVSRHLVLARHFSPARPAHFAQLPLAHWAG